MPAQLYERLGSRDFTAGPSGVQGKILWISIGASDQSEAHAAALVASPLVINGIPRGSITVNEAGIGVHMIDVDYDSGIRPEAITGTGSGSTGPGPNPGQVLGKDMSFSSTGGTQHITQSKEVVLVVTTAGISGLDVKNTIGGQAEGCDIVVPSGRFTISQKLQGSLEAGYITHCYHLTGQVNSDVFYNMDPGEVLFLGVEGGFTETDGWNFSWQFGFSPNEDNIVIGDMTVETKDGWDYLDVRYQKEKDEDSSLTVERPITVVVHRVYDRAPFASLGIGS